MAKQIDSALHKQRKVKKTNNWFIQSAKVLDIELDDDVYPKYILLYLNLE